MLTFRGFELDFDIFDADCAEDYEAELQRVQAAIAESHPDESMAEGIRRTCGVVFAFFDRLFGEGFHKELFGERVNMQQCLEAYVEFNGLVREQRKSIGGLVQKYMPEAGAAPGSVAVPPNRAARRAAARKRSL